jgi:hypothetical protein
MRELNLHHVSQYGFIGKHLLWQPLLYETRLVHYLQRRPLFQPVRQNSQAASLRSVLARRKENRFNSSENMNHAPENLSRRFVALDLPHYPRTSHLILRRFQRRQHGGVGQIQNLLETAYDHEVNEGLLGASTTPEAVIRDSASIRAVAAVVATYSLSNVPRGVKRPPSIFAPSPARTAVFLPPARF